MAVDWDFTRLIYGSMSSDARIDNIRFSRETRDYPVGVDGLILDTNYSSNLNTVRPVVEDDLTTLILNFEGSDSKNNNLVNNKILLTIIQETFIFSIFNS